MSACLHPSSASRPSLATVRPVQASQVLQGTQRGRAQVKGGWAHEGQAAGCSLLLHPLLDCRPTFAVLFTDVSQAPSSAQHIADAR